MNQISRLDTSMVHCGVVYLFCYRFAGQPDIAALQTSTERVLGALRRLQYPLLSGKHYRGRWGEQIISQPRFSCRAVTDLTKACDELYQQAGTTGSWLQQSPMHLSCLLQPEQQHFVLVQSGLHSYCDGNSATYLFNQILQFYTAVLANDTTQQQHILHSLQQLTSPSPDQLYALRGRPEHKVLPIGRWRHLVNTVRLICYPVRDHIRFATPFDQLQQGQPEVLPVATAPVQQQINLRQLLRVCDTRCPDVSPHNLVCALLAKAAWQLAKNRGQPLPDNRISFRVMVDLLNVKQRKLYIGNYIAYLPVTIDASIPLPALAQQVNQRVMQARQARQDVSMYKLLEFALSSGAANKQNDQVSFIVSAIGNQRLLSNPGLLPQCQYLDLQASANAVPADFAGVQLNNRPTICFHFNREQQLTLSFFNTWSDPAVRSSWLAHIRQLADSVVSGTADFAASGLTVSAGH